jgi:hypothetical protein
VKRVYSFSALVVICKARYRQPGDDGNNRGDAAIVADVTGLPLKRVAQWRVRGMGTTAADRAAVALGLHPGEIWPEWFDE